MVEADKSGINNTSDLGTKWHKIISSDKIDQKDKIDIIKYEARKLEERARRIEQLNKYDRSPINRQGEFASPMWDEHSVNDMLVESIKAKLEVLDKL